MPLPFKARSLLLYGSLLALTTMATAQPKDTTKTVQVASYYFGNYHPGDARNTALKGKDWSEWELVKMPNLASPVTSNRMCPSGATPMKAPPKSWPRKLKPPPITASMPSSSTGTTYNGTFLEDTINKGFLRAKNRNRLKFALMWANHDWMDLHPYRRGEPAKLLYPGKVTNESFDRICDHVIKDYFLQPTYPQPLKC